MKTQRNFVLARSALAAAMALGLSLPAVHAADASKDKTATSANKPARGEGASSVDAPATHGGSAPAKPGKMDEVFPKGSKSADKANSREGMQPAADPKAPAVEGGTTAGQPAKLNEVLPKGSKAPTEGEKAAKGERLAPAAKVDAPASHGGSKTDSKSGK